MTTSDRPTYGYRELNQLDALEVDHLCSLFTIELGGEQLYEQLAGKIADPQAAELLRRNGREEAGHARRVARAIAIKLGADFEPTPEMLQLRPVRLPDEIDAEFLAMLVQGERDGDAGYQRWADHETDPEVQRLLRLNGREETIHGRRVETVLAILGD
jgi:rubrerythrin